MVVIVIEVDLVSMGEDVPTWVSVSTTVLLWTYVVDIMMKIFAHRWAFLLNVTNLLDATVVLLDLLALIVQEVARSSDLPSLGFLRAFRLLRLYRLVKGIMIFRELVLMMQGLLSAVRAIVFGAFMIFLALTTWSILAVQFLQPHVRTLAASGHFDGCYDCEDAFSSVIKSNLTLWKTIVAGDGWGSVALPLLIHHPETALILIPAFISVQLGLVNVIAAVIVDRQTQARVSDDNLLHQIHNEELQRSYKRLHTLFESLDQDNGGSLTLEELISNYDTNAEFRSMLDMLDIQREDIPVVCEIMDVDGSGDVTYSEFVEKLHHIRFLNDHTLLVFIKQHCDMLRKEQRRSQENFDQFLREWSCVADQIKLEKDVADERKQQDGLLRGAASPRCSPPTEDKSRDVGYLQGRFASDDIQKQLSQRIASIMLPAVAQVVRDSLTHVRSEDSCFKDNGDYIDSDAMGISMATVDATVSSAEKDKDRERLSSRLRDLAGDTCEKKATHELLNAQPEAIAKSSAELMSCDLGDSDDIHGAPRRSFCSRVAARGEALRTCGSTELGMPEVPVVARSPRPREADQEVPLVSDVRLADSARVREGAGPRRSKFAMSIASSKGLKLNESPGDNSTIEDDVSRPSNEVCIQADKDSVAHVCRDWLGTPRQRTKAKLCDID
eukprot:TRINITY_DN3434_c0_g1_i3.p1 TRINITY_DN3434_c0_g1~~TRINITY_DN3434_c0_g1_i3.p1  ORF type:complete len:774 (+),score=103.52 TRINITY_DN3434_c0_g1_i3:319-2322(+)